MLIGFLSEDAGGVLFLCLVCDGIQVADVCLLISFSILSVRQLAVHYLRLKLELTPTLLDNQISCRSHWLRLVVIRLDR